MFVFVNGSRTFQNQIMNQLQDMEQRRYFSYTQNIEDAFIIISEGTIDTRMYPKCYSKIEVVEAPTLEKIAFQQVGKNRTASFPMRDLPAIMQSTILMMWIIYKKDEEISIQKDRLSKLLEEDNENEINQKTSRIVQLKVASDALNLPGFDTDLIYIPKNQVSGDYVLAEKVFDKVFIMIGDVTGHGSYCGTYAASLIAEAKGFLRTASPMTANLRSFASYMSEASFFYHGDSDRSSTENVFCEIDLKKNIAYFCTFGGGSITPVIIRKNGKVEKVFTAEEQGQILPRMGDTLYEDDDAPLPVVLSFYFDPGDAVLFYTDGITELFCSQEEKDIAYTYGPDNLIKSIKDVVSYLGNTPANIVKSIVSDVISYGVQGLETSTALESIVNDDATIYCIRRKEGQSEE